MSEPTFGNLTVGDTRDDDAAVIDTFVTPTSEPPTPQITPILATPLETPKPATRLISVSQLLVNTWGEPTLILPEDTRRKSLHIFCTSTDYETATGGFVLTSEKRAANGLGFLRHNQRITLDAHTGAVWAQAVGNNSCYIDVWSVTE